LALALRLHGNELGFYDLINEKWLVTPAEANLKRAEEAENRVEEETSARLHAEAELAQLREEIERLKLQTTSSQTNSQE